MSESDNSSSFSSEDDCQKPVKYFAGKSIPPGAIISQILIQKQMNLIEFSEKMNISQIEIKDILKGKKSITVDIATKLEKIFDMSADFWIEIEKNYQLNSALLEQKKVFEEEKFKTEVLYDEKVISAFDTYKTNFQDQHNVELPQEFGISNTAVKQEQKDFKSVLKLDRNFSIYIHGNRNYLEKGHDAETGLSFYKLFFEKEK